MKHSKKMVLVDIEEYNNQLKLANTPDIRSAYTKEIDMKIYEILQNEELNDYDKCKMYLETLRKYLHFLTEDIRKENEKHQNASNELKKVTNKLENRLTLTPSVKRLSRSPQKKRKKIAISKSRIPLLRQESWPRMKNWTSMKSEVRNE